jgi:hypothetical protein
MEKSKENKKPINNNTINFEFNDYDDEMLNELIPDELFENKKEIKVKLEKEEKEDNEEKKEKKEKEKKEKKIENLKEDENIINEKKIKEKEEEEEKKKEKEIYLKIKIKENESFYKIIKNKDKNLSEIFYNLDLNILNEKINILNLLNIFYLILKNINENNDFELTFPILNIILTSLIYSKKIKNILNFNYSNEFLNQNVNFFFI